MIIFSRLIPCLAALAMLAGCTDAPGGLAVSSSCDEDVLIGFVPEDALTIWPGDLVQIERGVVTNVPFVSTGDAPYLFVARNPSGVNPVMDEYEVHVSDVDLLVSSTQHVTLDAGCTLRGNHTVRLELVESTNLGG
jgi:hypothetical protein